MNKYGNWRIKLSIRKYISENKISYRELSYKTGIKIYKLIYILFSPFSRIKLTHGLAISRTLGINLSKLFDIQFDIH